MVELPSGTITFLFTDLESSTRLWEEHPEAMLGALARHDEIVRVAVTSHDGQIVKSTGDGFHAVFVDAARAVQAGIDAQRQLGREVWGDSGELRVRIGLHSGAAELRDGDYPGPTVNKAARIMSVAHGGQLVVSSSTAELASQRLPDDVKLIDLGEHRLRGLPRPERVFQVRAPGLATEFAPLTSLDAFPGNLPLQVTSFIGREREIAWTIEALSKARLVTLTGTGGVGKTRLSLQVAGEVLPQFRDGVWLCELAIATDADTLSEVVAATLKTARRAGLSLEDSIREFLGAKDLLLVLDNCEQLVDEIGRFTGRLLERCPGIRVLATSREALGIAGEQVYALRALDLPQATTPLEVIAASPAVQLFTERARAVRSDFSLDNANAHAIADICGRLDGIPLAIELAAARVVAMSPSDIAGRLDERFRLLTGGRRTAAERQQTLRSTVDWSYELLETLDRTTYTRLGVFAGSFDAAAAEAVAAGDDIEGWDVLDALTSLVAKSMVIADEDTDSTTHYQLLETLRYYALDHLDDADRWRRNHARHYAEFAELACQALLGPDEIQWRHRIRRDLDNLRAAVNWALERDTDDALLAVRIVAALARESYLDRSAGIGEWARRVFPRTTTASSGLRSAVAAAAAQEALGRDDIDDARAFASEGVAVGYPDDCPAPGLAHLALAGAHAYGSAPDVGARLIHEALDALSVDPHNAFSRTSLLARAAMLDTWSFDPRARLEAREALRLAREIDNPSLLTETLYALSWAELSEDPQAALDALEESISLTRAGASDGVFGGALAQAARLRARFGEHRAALELLRESIAHSYAIGYRRAAMFALSNGVEVLLQYGSTEQAAVISGWNPGRIELFGPEREIRATLGQESYQRAIAQGSDMTYDDIVSYALDHLDTVLQAT
jgi:predicted ATPase/class 3 adenylate cyclase